MISLWNNSVGILNYDEVNRFQTAYFGTGQKWRQSTARHDLEAHKVVKEMQEFGRYLTCTSIRNAVCPGLNRAKTEGLTNELWTRGSAPTSTTATLPIDDPPLRIVIVDSQGTWTVDDVVRSGPMTARITVCRLYILLDVSAYNMSWYDKDAQPVAFSEDQARTVTLWHELGHVRQLLEDPKLYYKMATSRNKLADADNLKRHERPLCREMGISPRWIYDQRNGVGNHDAQKQLKARLQRSVTTFRSMEM